MSQNVNASGRGRGVQGRGGTTAAGAAGGPGNLNPGATAFTPQGKRNREDGDDGGNMGKRIRGGGAGS